MPVIGNMRFMEMGPQLEDSPTVTRNAKITGGSKNSKANRIETGERSGGIGEICSVEVDEK